jgi:hypothetical protein
VTALILVAAGPAFAQTVTTDPLQGRLTLTSHTPILSADTIGATTLYYDSYNGGAYPNYSGTQDIKVTITSNEISDVIGTTSPAGALINQVVDEWGIAGGIICHATDGAGHGWSSDTGGSNAARGTGYSQIDTTSRYYVTNKNALAHCYNGTTNEGSIAANQATYLGTFWTIAAAGAVNMVFHPAPVNGGSNSCLCLFNGYNRVPAITTSRDNASGSNWSGTGLSTWAPADAGSTGSGLNNRLNWVDGLAAMIVDASYSVQRSSTGASQLAIVGVNFDATSGAPLASNNSLTGSTAFNGFTTGNSIQPPVFGAHFVQAMEFSSATLPFGSGTGNLTKASLQQ